MLGAELRRAAQVIRQGGLVAYPTEYCFGLGCDPMNRATVERLLRLKRRASDKGLILIAGDLEQLMPFVHSVPPHVIATWPGPHTWVLPATRHTPGWIRGQHAGVAVRVTSHLIARALCREAHLALTSTSANLSGQQPARSDREVWRRFGATLDYVVPGRVGELRAPTPIRDAISGARVRA